MDGMSKQNVTSLKDAQANLAALCNKAIETRESLIIRRTDGDDVALIAADELAALRETAHLVRSPDNAQRLLDALASADDQTDASVDDIRRALGLDPE